MLFQEIPDEMPDFPRCGRVHILAKFNEGIPVLLFQTKNQLAVFVLVFFLGGHRGPLTNRIACVYTLHIPCKANATNTLEAIKMNLLTARNIILSDRLDWRRPHLSWLPSFAYFNTSRRKI